VSLCQEFARLRTHDVGSPTPVISVGLCGNNAYVRTREFRAYHRRTEPINQNVKPSRAHWPEDNTSGNLRLARPMPCPCSAVLNFDLMAKRTTPPWPDLKLGLPTMRTLMLGLGVVTGALDFLRADN
jgi:hypothetical protein